MLKSTLHETRYDDLFHVYFKNGGRRVNYFVQDRVSEATEVRRTFLV